MAVKRQKLVIWGAGGHASVVADIARQTQAREIVGFVDDVARGRRSRNFLGVRVLRGKEGLAGLLEEGAVEIVIAVGDCAARLRLAAMATAMGFRLCSLVHPRATVASTAKIGAGTVIMAGAVVNPGAVLGENVIINTCASVDHDCVLEDGVHICPGTHLAGEVTVGRGTWVGIGTAVIDGRRIGRGAFIGAGSVVVKNIPDQVLALGVPAAVVRKLAKRACGCV